MSAYEGLCPCCGELECNKPDKATNPAQDVSDAALGAALRESIHGREIGYSERKLIDRARELQQAQVVGDWYCPHCQRGVDGREVTYTEQHETCGTYIGNAEPPATPQSSAPVVGDAMTGKYGDVLRPFVAIMERELHANAGKGDRPGWLQMDAKTALLEIYYHVAKLQKSVKNSDGDKIIENAADVANMAMMLLDVCGGLDIESALTGRG